MSDMKARTLGRKNLKGLALNPPPPKSPAPSAGDAQIPGALGNNISDSGTLEIGVEFKLDLRNEDLIVLKELGAGNGGTVSKVMHAATKTVMAKKVLHGGKFEVTQAEVDCRSYMSKQRKTFANRLSESCISCMDARHQISSSFTGPFCTPREMSLCVWNTWTAGQSALAACDFYMF